MDSLYIYNKVYLLHQEVTTDSRRPAAGSMFFALRGERFDGNAYAEQAVAAGCAVAVVDDAAVAERLGDRALLVPDVLTTLQELAAEHRRRFRGTVLQVTGTNGKTTTKELLAAVLSRRYRVLYTQGNLNNHIGVPLTLLRLRPEHEVAIIETGANHPGEIAALTRIVQPDCGLVTNVGRAHLEGFGSFDGVKRTKGELYDYLSAHDGTLFVNGDDTDLMAMASERGFAAEHIVRYVPGAISADSGAEMSMTWIDSEGHGHRVQTHLVGRYNMANVRAAATVGSHFGVAATDINAALTDYVPSLGRSELRRTATNELIVDAYNANPTSMMAALDNFCNMRHAHKMLILGDMRELGAESASEHTRVLSAALASDAKTIWLVGEEFGKAAAAQNDARVTCFPDVAAVKSCIATSRPEHRLILIKGSNGTRLHELPEIL